MKSIIDYSRKEIEKGIKEAREKHEKINDHIRILFAPVTINETNFDRVCDVYSRLDAANYDTVVVVEEHHEVLDKKLPMPSNQIFETPLGAVPVNDYMRNEFCDEDDDFFIHDEAFSKDMCLFHQLMMLQVALNSFQAVSVQIADENHFIVKELAHVLEEVLASRNVLLVFCCDLDSGYKDEFIRLKELVDGGLHSNLLNYLNSGESHIKGTAAFVTGVLVADEWEMRCNFLGDESQGSLLTAYADRQQVMY